MHLAAGGTHPLVANRASVGGAVASASRRVGLSEVLAHGFACPSRSMFCGIDRAARSDGWRDDQAPRRIQFWLEDLQLLTALVKSGQALAYLPDFALAEPGLVRLDVADYPFASLEEAHLVWQPGTAPGWLGRLVDGAVAP